MPRNTESLQVVDRNIGQKISEIRKARGLSRQQLASKIGVTHQQLQKYEKGINSARMGRLVLAAEVLKMPLIHFISDFNEDVGEAEGDRLAIELQRSFQKIKSHAQREALNRLARTMAND